MSKTTKPITTGELQDAIVLIPGASRPLGRAIARKFADTGASLVLPLYHDWPEAAEEMKDEFTSAGYRFFCFPCDLRNPQETSRLIEQTQQKFGALHIVINNIERGGMPIVHGSYDLEQNQGQWELEFATTVTAKWNLFHYSLPLVRKSGAGVFINISSMAARIGRSGPASLLYSEGYSAANRCISSFTETWAREAAPDVRVNEIMLGLVRGRHAEGTRGWSLLSDRQRQDLLDHTLLQRSGRPDEVAEIVYFLSVKAHYVTGSSLLVDGGYCLGSEKVLPLPPGVL